MDGRRNWILVDAVSSQAENAPIRVGGRNFPATHSRDEQSFLTMNKLNERIQRRLAEQADAGEGARVVEESFRFIEDEPTDRLDQLIAQRDSRGEVEAIFERRREPGPARRIEPRMWPAIEELPEPPDDTGEEPIYKNSPALYLEPSIRFENSRYRRRESVDSQMTRVVRPSDYHSNFYGRSILPPTDERRPPMTLRRTPLFYDKCDLCAYKIFRTGDFCPACGKTASPMRQPRSTSHPYTEMLLSPPRLLQEPWANRHYSGYNITRPDRSRQQQYYNVNGIRPRTMWTARRRTQRPVYRYGSSLPEAMYDYEVWAKKKDSRLKKRKAAAIAFALLALALVISAGVVLATVRN